MTNLTKLSSSKSTDAESYSDLGAPSGDLSRLVEQSVERLHTMEERLTSVQSDLANLLQMSLSSPSPNPNSYPSPSSYASPGAFANANPFSNPGPVSAWSPAYARPSFGSPTEGLGFAFGYGAYPALPRSAPSFTPIASFPESRTTKEFTNQPPTPRAPEINLADAGDEYLAQVELPGVRKEDLEITVSERAIAISATSRPNLTDGAILVGERGPVQYRRTIPLPTSCNTSQSKASLKDGYLTLRVPKKEPKAGPKRLDVAYG